MKHSFPPTPKVANLPLLRQASTWILAVWTSALVGLCSPAAADALNPAWQIHWDTPSNLQPTDLYASTLPWQPDARHGIYGYRGGVFWATFEVPAVASGHAGTLLSVGLPYLDRIDVYQWGQTEPLASMGDTLPVPQARLSGSSHVLRLPALQTPQRYLLRVQSTSAMNIRADLLTDDELLQTQAEPPFKAGVFVALYALSAIMYVVGAVVMRQPVQLAYSMYLLCLLAIFVGVSQPILLNEWLGSPRWANWVTGFGILLAPAAAALLWISILQLHHRYTKIFKAYRGLMLISAMSLLTINTAYYQQAAQAAILGILLFSVFNLGLALWCMRRPDQRATVGLFVLAFLLSTVTAIINNLSVAGLIASQPWFAAAFDASSLVHVLFFAIATNLSIRKLEKDHHESQFQQRLLANQRDQVQAFSGFVAHELLNPLARIGRSAEMLAREPHLPERVSRRAFDLKTWAFEAGKLVEVFLNTASLQSGRAMVTPVVTDLAAWLRSVQTELALNYPQADLCWQLTPAMQHANFDPLLTKLALENIVINALKYAGAQSAVVIEVTAESHQLVITVDDSGPGLAPSQYPLVGQAALLRQPTQEQPGFGLGLSLVAHIAKAHGGDFSASARQPGGVRWVLRLAQDASETRPSTKA